MQTQTFHLSIKFKHLKKFNSGLFDVAFLKYTQRLQSTWDLELKLINQMIQQKPQNVIVGAEIEEPTHHIKRT